MVVMIAASWFTLPAWIFWILTYPILALVLMGVVYTLIAWLCYYGVRNWLRRPTDDE